MQDIQTFCRKLIYVDIGVSDGRWEAHEELYISYGAQLKYAMLYNRRTGGISSAKLQEILSVCPMLNVTYRVDDGSMHLQ